MKHKRAIILVETFRASDIPGIVPDLKIETSKSPPEFQDLKDAGKFYEREAKKLCNALFKCLPGGLMDALFLEIMKQKVSLLRIPF